MNARFLVCLAALASSLLALPVHSKSAFQSGRLDFEVQINDLKNNLSVMAYSVMPGEEVRIESKVSLSARAERGHLEKEKNHWLWIAPVKPGLYPIKLRKNGQFMTLNMFVLRPASEIRNGHLGKYHIGAYQKVPFRGLAVYRAPKGFIEVTRENQETLVSPHLRLKQFLCKQQPGTWPKYMLLRPQLLHKLEAVLERVNKAGIRTDSLVIMSGYRTPWYNYSIGNRTSSSRHLYGGAADIFIDVNPVDGVMDDLNGDGKLNKADADYLYDLLEGWSDEPLWKRFIGGHASYGANAAHGPFVHIDARGYRARWGR